MAAADEDEAVRAFPEGRAEPRQVVGDRARQQFDPAADRLERLGQPGLERPEVDAVRVGEQPFQVQAVGVGAEARIGLGSNSPVIVPPSSIIEKSAR